MIKSLLSRSKTVRAFAADFYALLMEDMPHEFKEGHNGTRGLYEDQFTAHWRTVPSKVVGLDTYSIMFDEASVKTSLKAAASNMVADISRVARTWGYKRVTQTQQLKSMTFYVGTKNHTIVLMVLS